MSFKGKKWTSSLRQASELMLTRLALSANQLAAESYLTNQSETWIPSCFFVRTVEISFESFRYFEKLNISLASLALVKL